MKIKKYKICKRLGPGVFEKCQTPQFSLAEQRAGRKKLKRRPSRSGFALQLLEKQRVRISYGIAEKQFSKYVKEASSARAKSSEALYKKIETRLDNVVFRLGLAKTRRQARQLVSHGHISVNGKKVNIPSYSVSTGEKISVRSGSKDKKVFDTVTANDIPTLPNWLDFDITQKEGLVKSMPASDDGAFPFDLQQVVEFYSR